MTERNYCHSVTCAKWIKHYIGYFDTSVSERLISAQNAFLPLAGLSCKLEWKSTYLNRGELCSVVHSWSVKSPFCMYDRCLLSNLAKLASQLLTLLYPIIHFFDSKSPSGLSHFHSDYFTVNYYSSLYHHYARATYPWYTVIPSKTLS